MLNLPPKGQLFQVEALNLRYYDFNDTDRILVCLTREYGVLRLIAKGVKRPKSKMGSCTEPLRHQRLHLRRGQNLHALQQWDNLSSQTGLWQDYDSLLIALAIGDISATFNQEMDAQPEFFNFLLQTLNGLKSTQSPQAVLVWFMLHYLTHLGYAQDFFHCQNCEGNLSQEPAFFHLSAGGFYCQKCTPKKETLYLNKQQFALVLELMQLNSPPISLSSPKQSLNRIQYFLHQYFEVLAEKEIKSLGFLHRELLKETQLVR